jgi:hypothetical protein
VTETELLRENARLTVAYRALTEFIDSCCAWSDGPTVNGGFDTPWLAEAARELIGKYPLLPRPEVVPPGWQPIATAPRDGTLIDLWGDNHGLQSRWAECVWDKESDAWIWPQDSEFEMADVTFTHWMPLPKGPDEK